MVPAIVVREKFFRAAPLLLAAGLVWIVLAQRREGETALDGRWREHLVVWAFALGALPRILLRSGVDHYGFYLLPPTLVCVAIGMTRLLAGRSGPPRSPRILAIAASTVLAGVALDGFLVAHAKFSRPMTEVRTARVWRLMDSEGAEAALVPYLSRFPPSTVVAAVPDGAGLIFASGLTPMDDGMIAYIPMHLHGPATERRRAASLGAQASAAHRPLGRGSEVRVRLRGVRTGLRRRAGAVDLRSVTRSRGSSLARRSSSCPRHRG